MSLMVTYAKSAWAAVGVKVTEIVQLLPAATVAPQVLAWTFGPVTAIWDRTKSAVPVFVSVIVGTVMGKPSNWVTIAEVELKETAGAGALALRVVDCNI